MTDEEKRGAIRNVIIRASQEAIERCYAGDDPLAIIDRFESELIDYELCVCGHFRVEHLPPPETNCDLYDCECGAFRPQTDHE